MYDDEKIYSNSFSLLSLSASFSDGIFVAGAVYWGSEVAVRNDRYLYFWSLVGFNIHFLHCTEVLSKIHEQRLGKYRAQFRTVTCSSCINHPVSIISYSFGYLVFLLNFLGRGDMARTFYFICSSSCYRTFLLRSCSAERVYQKNSVCFTLLRCCSVWYRDSTVFVSTIDRFLSFWDEQSRSLWSRLLSA